MFFLNLKLTSRRMGCFRIKVFIKAISLHLYSAFLPVSEDLSKIQTCYVYLPHQKTKTYFSTKFDVDGRNVKKSWSLRNSSRYSQKWLSHNDRITTYFPSYYFLNNTYQFYKQYFKLKINIKIKICSLKPLKQFSCFPQNWKKITKFQGKKLYVQTQYN